MSNVAKIEAYVETKNNKNNKNEERRFETTQTLIDRKVSYWLI